MRNKIFIQKFSRNKAERKGQVWGHARRWEDGMETNGCECMDWVQLAEDGQKMGSGENENEPCGTIKTGKFLDYLSDI
jgi:hypothetical protein